MVDIDKRLENLAKMADNAVAYYDSLLKDINEIGKKLEKAETILKEMKEIDGKRI